MEDRRIEDKRIEINRRLREIQDEVALNKKEQACINEIIDDVIALRQRSSNTQEEMLEYWAGTEFGRVVAELNSQEDALYSSLIRDAEVGIEERRQTIQRLLKEERECEDEIMQMRRDY